MEAVWLSSGLVEAKRVAEAMATGDVRPLVLATHQIEDCTEDMIASLKRLVKLVSKTHKGLRATEVA